MLVSEKFDECHPRKIEKAETFETNDKSEISALSVKQSADKIETTLPGIDISRKASDEPSRDRPAVVHVFDESSQDNGDSAREETGSSSDDYKLLNSARIRAKRDKPVHVLLVDDSATVRKVTKLKLESSGYTVEVASNGEEALGKLADKPRGFYDIILLDIYMPVLDGVRLANIIREREILDGGVFHQLIIGLSSETRDITVDIMDACLVKPFDIESFESCMIMFRIK